MTPTNLVAALVILPCSGPTLAQSKRLVTPEVSESLVLIDEFGQTTRRSYHERVFAVVADEGHRRSNGEALCNGAVTPGSGVERSHPGKCQLTATGGRLFCLRVIARGGGSRRGFFSRSLERFSKRAAHG